MKKVLKVFAIILLIVMLSVITVAGVFIHNIMRSTKNVEFNKEKLVSASMQITMLDNNNEEFGENVNVIKQVIEIDNLPPHVGDSFVSIEDKRFYSHSGLDYKRIIKAMYNNIKSRQIKEGASTISQQLIKNSHLSNERTFSRKLNEMYLTRKLEKEFSKKDILETYLNIIYFGEGSYGIESASKTYFNKPAKDLDISESATLAGLIKSPARYSPIYNPENALARRNLVLKQMLNNNKITQSQYEAEIKKELNINLNKNTAQSTYNLYAKAVLNEASSILNLSEKDTAMQGLKIYTYLDSNIQNTLSETIYNDNYYHINKHGNIADSLGIVIDNKTHGVSAFAGRSKYDLTNFKRQPGSTLKPLISYAPAIEKGLLHSSTQILDDSINYNGYSPNNVGGNFYGYVSVKESLSKSLNIPAIKALDYVGIDNAKKFAQKAGITFHENDTGLSVALGGFTEGSSLQEITNSFTPFANSGFYKDAKFIKKIVNSAGKTLYENSIIKNQIMSPETSFIVNHMLIDGVKNGTSSRLKNLNYEVAGKTGTVGIPNTNNNTDAFSVAYTTDHTMGVWLGNYSNDPQFVLEGSNNGGTFATSIIKDSFEKIYENKKPNNFKIPSGIVELEIDAKVLQDDHIIKLATENTPDRYKQKEYFIKKFAPTEYSDIFDSLTIDSFDVLYFNNIVNISLSAKDYLKYEIIKVHNNTETVLKTIENKSGNIEIQDSKLLSKTKYGYKVKAYNMHSNIYNESNIIYIYTSNLNRFDEIINKTKIENSTNHWFFR